MTRAHVATLQFIHRTVSKWIFFFLSYKYTEHDKYYEHKEQRAKCVYPRQAHVHKNREMNVAESMCLIYLFSVPL